MFDQSLATNNTRNTRTLIWSLGIHVVFTIAIFLAGFALKQGVIARRDTSVRFISMPSTIPHPPPTRRATVRLPPIAPKAFAVPRLAALPAPSLRTLAPPVMEQQASSIPAPVIQAPPALLAPAPEIPPPARTGVFSSATTVVTGDPNTTAQVRTGGFSTASISDNQSNRATQITAAGFGDPGLAPAAGMRRSVSAGGFGDAGAARSGSRARDTVRGGGFGDAVAAAPSAAMRSQSANVEAAAQILEKPHPVYTEEARRLQIQGEVQLEIVFRASGEIRILRVVRGLGHGLDENAADAAKGIRFLPAKKDGRPVDSVAMVHIIFQLA